MHTSTVIAALGFPLLLVSAASMAQTAADPVPAESGSDPAARHPVFQHAAPRTLPGAKRASERHPLAPDDAAEGALQTGQLASWPRLWRQDGLLVTGSLTGTLGLFAMTNNLFDPPPALNTAQVPIRPRWGEFFLEPGLKAEYQFGRGVTAYGAAAYMETGTRGTDYGGVPNTTHGDMELLYAGVRWADTAHAASVDASYGQQDFTVANNFLLASGASNGAQRGANYMGPRAAWANAALLKAKWGNFAAQGFWLKPNESTSGATGTRLAGINADWAGGGPVDLGAMWVRAPESDIVTRDGLDTYNLRATVRPPMWKGVSIEGEYAWQRKSGVAASGWYVEGTWSAVDAPWKPLAVLRYASFSGDDPGTARWEGFDPLYYGGTDPDWYQGKVASTFLGNTNLDAWAASLTLAPGAKHLLQFVGLYFAADTTNAPLAVPAAGKPIPTGGGVPARAIGTELDAIYTYTFDKSVNVNLFAGYLAPGAGYKQLYEANGGSASGWWVVGTQFNMSY